ncbi:MAG: TetR/AcrR family transcriptional regulator [Acidimicrobiia bacterium]|nr:TetR/AcrR family transcriptional regulator [Acidimicrobiia bacterium]
MPTATASSNPTETQSGRERILAAAAQRFLEAGYVETSLRDLAADVGMKAGSMYYHFESKDALLIAVLERGMTFMVEAFEGVVEQFAAADPPDAERRLTAHITAHLRALHDNRAFTAGHVTLFRTAPEAVREAVLPLRDDYEARWTDLLADVLPDRPIGDLTMLRLGLFGAMNASIEWLDTGRGTVDRFARLIAAQFWYGVGSGAPSNTAGKGKR